MSDININGVRSNNVSGDQLPRLDSVNSQPLKSAVSDKSPDQPADSVTLSLGTVSANKTVSHTSQLTDAQATDASLSLRAQLTKTGLSAKAQQNQAILSLLR